MAASSTDPPPTATIRSGRSSVIARTPARISSSGGSGEIPEKTCTEAPSGRCARTSSAVPRRSVSASVTTSTRSVCSSRRLSSDPGLKYVSDGTRNHCGGACRRETVLMFMRLR